MSIAIVKKSEEALATAAREAAAAEEPVTPRGLPAPLPKGETILWQGKPAWRTLARRAMHLRGMSLYFGFLAAWTFGDTLYRGGGVPDALLAATWLLVIGAVAIGLLSLYAWLSARSTYITLTNERVILSFGVALPMSMNVPYALVESAALKLWPNGTGDIPILVKSERRLSYILLWPNVRPWRFTRVEPMLRAIPEAERVAGILAERLKAVHGEETTEASTQAGRATAGERSRDAGLSPAAA